MTKTKVRRVFYLSALLDSQLLDLAKANGATLSETARLLLGRAFRLEGGFGEVNDVSGAFDVFDRRGSEFPPFVREPYVDETPWLNLDKDLSALGRLERLEDGLAFL